MNITVNKTEFLTALAAASKATPSNSSLAALEGVHIVTDDQLCTVTGYNLTTAITARLDADVKIPGAAVIPAKMLIEIVRKLPDSEVNLTVDAGCMACISSGASNFRVKGLPPEQFPALPDTTNATSVTLPQKKLKTMLAGTLYAARDDDSNAVYTGALFDMGASGLTVVALDGFRLALHSEKLDKLPDMKCIIPRAALQEVERLLEDSGNVLLSIGERHTWFELNGTTIITRFLEGAFTEYRKAIPKGGNIVLTVDAKTLMYCVERVSVIHNDDRIKPPVKMLCKDDRIELTQVSAAGKSADVCTCVGDGGGLLIGFNHQYLLNALKTCSGDVRLTFTQPLAPCVITPESGEDYLHLLLPVRMKQ